MAFRLYDQLPQYRLADGTLCAGGSLVFSITGTSTAKAVYGEPALSTNLGSTITLDADARHSEDVWLAEDAAYRVILKDSAGATIWTRNTVRALDTSASVGVPSAATGAAGDVLKTDGTAGGWYFEALLAIPSASGQSGKVLGNDGANLLWQAAAATYSASSLPGGIVETTAGSNLLIGTTRIQCGSGTVATAAAVQAQVAVTFTTAFSSTPKVIISATIGGVTSDSPSASCSMHALSVSSSGFTAHAFAGAENNSTTANTYITTPVTFNWIAMGPA